MNIQYLTEKEIFDTVIAKSKGYTQTEMAEHLEVSQPSISKMLNRESKMISLAIKCIEMVPPVLDWQIERNENDKPVTYYKAVSND